MEKHAFTGKVRTLGRYMRWLACSMLPNVYQERMENDECNWPQSSTLYYMWTALEDYILDRIVEFITSERVQHLSLHYDGVRVQYNEPISNVAELCQDITLHVAKETGFTVQLKEKKHYPLFAMMHSLSKVQDTTSVALPDILKQDGQCIPVALQTLGRLHSGIVRDLESASTTVANRSYRDVLAMSKIGVACISLGISMDSEGDYLLHAENDGLPHCVAIRRSGSEVTLWQAGVAHCMSYASLLSCLMECTDYRSVVIITLQPTASVQQDADLGPISRLLDLRAGAGVRKRLTTKSMDAGTFWETPDIMASLKAEVTQVTVQQQQQPATKCPFCPFRNFRRPNRLANHLEKHHTATNRYCPSGTKQFKIACALFDWNRIRRQTCCTLLRDSVDLLRKSIDPPLSSTSNVIDKDIKMVFQGDGPRFQGREFIDDSDVMRRCGNAYYTHDFATLFFQSMVVNNSNLVRTKDELIARTCEAQNPLASLYRSTSRYWWPIVEDVMTSPSVCRLSSELVKDLVSIREYESISVDDTVKICMPIVGQVLPRRSQRLSAKVIVFRDQERYRCVFTTRGRSGCLLDLLPQPNNKDENMITAIVKSVPPEANDQVTFVSADRCSSELHDRLSHIFHDSACYA